MLLFISDMHLQEERPEITRAFLQLLKTQAPKAQALYLLGDVFNYWVGDDAMTDYHRLIANALKELAQTGTQVFLMHGNRDFALGNDFCHQAGCTLIPDPYVICPFGEPILLMHGDSLCTQDKGYQVLRYLLRHSVINYCLHRLPLSWRLKIGSKARQASQNRKQPVNPYIIDVTETAVIKHLEQHQSCCLIHGHTHRPAVHDLHVKIEGKQLPAKRYVLGDWSDQQGWKITLEKDDIQLSEFSFSDF